ncbi:hypothetical protein GEMRC1_008920 [Eukaryota sp. GEM-RC1]
MKHERRKQLLIQQSERDYHRQCREEEELRERIQREKELEKERKIEQQQARIAAEKERQLDSIYRQWSSHISVVAEGEYNPLIDGKDEELQMSIYDHIKQFKRSLVSDLAIRFKLSEKDVKQRLERLVAEKHIVAYLENDMFVYLDDQEVSSITSGIEEKKKFSTEEFRSMCDDVIKST